MTRVLALDYGRARCGVAISDPTGTLATPIAAIDRPRSPRGLARVVQVVRELLQQVALRRVRPQVVMGVDDGQLGLQHGFVVQREPVRAMGNPEQQGFRRQRQFSSSLIAFAMAPQRL